MLSSTDVRAKYPKLIEYFEKGIKNPDRNIAHCILLYGTDIKVQYDLALEVARMLNCKEGGAPECQCLNCRWIRDNAHPEVRTISKVDNKPVNDKSSNVISITQARNIKRDLLVSSDYHRVLIFCDKDKDNQVAGLNPSNFSEDAINGLLKTFEEPPSRTTFFFLTKDKSDMITTVVSRAQSFFVPSKLPESRDFSIVKEALSDYLEIERSQVLEFNDRIFALVKENDATEVLTQMQNYFYEMVSKNYENRLLRIRLLKDLKSIEKAKSELRVNMNVQTVFETLSFSMLL